MSELLKITLPDGSVREVPPGTTPADIAAAIGPGLAKAAIGARVNGELFDITRPFEGDSQLALVTARDEADALELVRHDYAHVLAEAVQALFPGTQITFGPSTDDGFYYDFAPKERPFTEEDLPAIEAEMRRIIAADKPLRREVWDRADLIERWREQGEIFKAEWAAELPGDEELTVYWSGSDWLDMCRGPHLASTGKLDPAAFKLTRVSGAYWRGDQANAMLSRVYGTGWLNKKQLDAHLTRLEEAAKRDHRRLGAEMDLFHLQQEAHPPQVDAQHRAAQLRTQPAHTQHRAITANRNQHIRRRQPRAFLSRSQCGALRAAAVRGAQAGINRICQLFGARHLRIVKNQKAFLSHGRSLHHGECGGRLRGNAARCRAAGCCPA